MLTTCTCERTILMGCLCRDRGTVGKQSLNAIACSSETEQLATDLLYFS